jgi:hypothetical protein
MTPNRLAMAHHEAGHAVAYLRHGFTVYCASLHTDPSQPIAGSVWCDLSGDMDVAKLICILAGPLAEHRVRQIYDLTNPQQQRDAMADDRRKIIKLAEKLPAGMTLDQVLADARRFVLESWDDIRVVARSLLRHGLLGGDYINGLLNRQRSPRCAA